MKTKTFKNFKIIETNEDIKQIKLFTTEEEAEVEAIENGFNFYRDYDEGRFYIEKQ